MFNHSIYSATTVSYSFSEVQTFFWHNITPESLDNFPRNRWTTSIGIGGQLAPEYADAIGAFVVSEKVSNVLSELLRDVEYDEAISLEANIENASRSVRECIKKVKELASPCLRFLGRGKAGNPHEIWKEWRLIRIS
jgi:hypothetical protein